MAANDDARFSIDKVKVNFFVRYDMDPSSMAPVPHVLTKERYRTCADGPYDSWLLLEEDRPEAEVDGAAATADAVMVGA